MVAFQSNNGIFFKQGIACIGTYINTLASIIGVFGVYGDVVGGLEDLSDLGMDFRLRYFQPNYFKQR